MAKKEKEVKEKKTSYFKAMKSELKKVTWPTPKELINNTVAVISFVVIISLIVFVLDTVFIKDYLYNRPGHRIFQIGNNVKLLKN